MLESLKNRLFVTDEYFNEVDVPNDQSVQFEEYSTPERESEAGVQWVLQKMEEGIAAERIGLLAPTTDRSGSLISYLMSGMEQLDLEQSSIFELTSSLSLQELPRGYAVLLLVRTLRQNLPQEQMVRLLPLFDMNDDVSLSAPDWRELVYESGMIGGSPARPADAENWLRDFEHKIDVLTEKIDERTDTDSDPRHAHGFSKIARWKAGLEAYYQPLEEIVEIQRRIHPVTSDGDPMDLLMLWGDIQSFADSYLNLGYKGVDILGSVVENIEDVLPPDISRSIKGQKALDLLQALVREVTITHPGNRSDGITVGTLQNARYRSFDAVRLVGLTENTMPDVPRENPILPDSIRRNLNQSITEKKDRGLTLSRDTARLKRRCLHQLIESTAGEIVFTTSRKDQDGTKRSFSSLFVDLALASGMEEEDADSNLSIPDESFLRKQMENGRQYLRENFVPLRPLDKIETDSGKNKRIVPKSWTEPEQSAYDLSRTLDLYSTEKSPDQMGIMDGMLPDDIPSEILNGLTSERHLSASAGKTLIQCPHWFLYDRMLDYDDPPEPPPSSELSALHFGSLVHRTAELLYERVQDEEGSIETARELMHDFVDSEFDELLKEYALVGEDTRRREKQRLADAIRNLLDIDYRRFKRDMRLEDHITALSDEGVHLHGYLDRIEEAGENSTYIRDIKSGSAKTDDEIIPEVDLQLGIYLKALEKQTDRNIEEVSYLYPVTPWHPERTFSRTPENEELSLNELSSRTGQWLSLIQSLLEERVFPRTEDEDDCTWCPFKPVCGSKAQERSAQKIDATNPDWRSDFLARKETDDA